MRKQSTYLILAAYPTSSVGESQGIASQQSNQGI